MGPSPPNETPTPSAHTHDRTGATTGAMQRRHNAARCDAAPEPMSPAGSLAHPPPRHISANARALMVPWELGRLASRFQTCGMDESRQRSRSRRRDDRSAGIATASPSTRLLAQRSAANSMALAHRAVRADPANEGPLPPWTTWGSLLSASRSPRQYFRRSSLGEVAGPLVSGASGCTDRTHRALEAGGARCHRAGLPQR